MMYLITDLKMVESYGRVKADSGAAALDEYAIGAGFADLLEFVAAQPWFARDLMAVQLQ